MRRASLRSLGSAETSSDVGALPPGCRVWLPSAGTDDPMRAELLTGLGRVYGVHLLATLVFHLYTEDARGMATVAGAVAATTRGCVVYFVPDEVGLGCRACLDRMIASE